MGKVKQTVVKVSKPVVTKSKNKNRINKKKATKTNGLAPILKKIGIDELLNDSEPKLKFELQVDDKTPVKNLLALPKNDLFDEDQIQSGVRALYKLIEKTQHGKELKLFEDGELIFLQITCIKVPKTPSRQIHLAMPHSLLKPGSEICLIVQDREDPKDYDNTIEYYEKLLKKHGIVNIKCIMPYHQFKNEYGNQFELKRKLAGLYDFFLVDGAVHGYVVSRLGKVFYTKRKMPVAFNMKATNLKGHLEKLLHRTVLQVHSKSDCYSVEVGSTKMKFEEVAENVIAIVEALNDNLPGGSTNVRSLGIKSAKSMTIPLYLTLRTKKSVKVPVIKAKRPKDFQPVVGELTTFKNREVTVLPSGKVIVKDLKRRRRVAVNDDLEFDDQQSESEDEEKPKTLVKKEKQSKKKLKKEKDLEEEEESEDSNLEEAEENYLNFYEQQQVKMAKDLKANKKNKQQNREVVEEDEESEDDLHLLDSDESDFDDIEHPNFDESDESDIDDDDDDSDVNLHQEKSNKKGNQNAKGEKLNGNKQPEGKKGKPKVKKEVIPIKTEVLTSGPKNKKSIKKQNTTETKQNKKGVLTKQNMNTMEAPSKKLKNSKGGKPFMKKGK